MPFSDASDKPLTYASYLKIEELLALQKPLSDGPEHDELLFIIIHQVYELWFKQILHEVDRLCILLPAGDTTGALATFKRVLTVLKIEVAQVDVIETMTPVSFNSFRSRLDSASGFQSAQFRELEFALGKKSEAVLTHHPEGSAGHTALAARLAQPTLYDYFLRYLSTQDYAVPTEVLERDITTEYAPNDSVQKLLLQIYHNDPLVRMVCERLVDLDEGLQEWRYRHVKMVERTIGAKIGTGGSAGTAYLQNTLFKPLFPDLWAIRSEL